MDSVIQAMHLGALDFLRKPLRLMDLQSAIERSQKSQINDIAIFLPNEKIPLSLRPSVKIVGR
jgi:DNA-binding NtrC family response regulator